MKPNRRGEVPVMAWVPASDVIRFRQLYPKQGAVTDLVRRAFKIAIAETPKTEEAARHNVEATLGPSQVQGPED